jgi:ribosomal protein S18 acetylase RimI-like enzyme
MSKFRLIINELDISSQIANLLNVHNNLSITHTGPSIAINNIKYIVEQGIVDNTLVIVGCVGLLLTTEDTTLIKHLCVHQNKRNMGIATRLMNTALGSITTSFAHMNIRSNNYPSLSLAEKLGFLIITQRQKVGYNVVTVGKKVHDNGRNNRLYRGGNL